MPTAGLLTGSLTQAISALLPQPGSPPGPSGLGGAAPSAVGAGWEIYVRSHKDYTTLLCQIPSKTWTTFQFAKMLADVGSGSVTLNMDDPWWKAVTLGDGSTANTILDYECLWQFSQDGVPRFEFLGETVSEVLVDASEARLVTITGPGTAAALKWGMAAPEGFPNIVLKLDGMTDAFDEISASGQPVLDTNIWTTVSPSGSVFITPVANAFAYPGGSRFALSSLFPTGTLTIQATAGTTVLGSAPWDATDTLISLQVNPVGNKGSVTDANGTAILYGDGLDGHELTQVYVQSLKDSSNQAGFGLSSTDFYCWMSSDSGQQTKVISAASAYDASNDAYWMITEQGGSGGGPGTFFFWTSPDGQAWVLRWQVVHMWDATYVEFFVTATYDVAGQVAVIQSLNSNVQAPSYQGNLYLNESMFGIWLDILQSAQARGTIPFVTTQFTSAADTFGNAWTDTNNLQVTNGTDLFTLLQSFCSVTNSDFVMQPGFNLQVGRDIAQGGGFVGLGTDRSQQIVLHEARDELAKQRTRTRNQIANLIGAENQDGREISALASASVVLWGQREGWYQTGAQVDPVSMELAAAAAVATNSTEVLSWTLSIPPGLPGHTVFENFDVGDWVGLERPDFSANDAVRVAGIAVQVDAAGVETNELTLVSYIQWLQEQLTYLTGKLGGAFVSIAGTTPIADNHYGIGQVPTYFTPAASLGSLADVVGTTSAADGAPLVYNAATGSWQPATSTDPSTGLPQGIAIPGPGGTVTIGNGGVTVTGQPAKVGSESGVIVPVPSITTSPTGQVVVDPSGNTRILVGTQPDGTITITELNAPAPALPSTPVVVNGPSSLAVGWNGLLGGSAPLSDFKWCEVHVSVTTGFTPSAATLQGTLNSPAGGILNVGGLTPGTVYYVKLVARNKANVASPASSQTAGLPVAGGPQVTIGLTAPSSPAVGDLWFNGNNGYQLEQWNGSAWVPYQWGSTAIAAGAITAVQIAANTITAAQIQAGAITATQLAAGTITSSQIAAGTITAGDIAAGTITAQLLAAGLVVAGIIDGTTITGNTINGAVFNGPDFRINSAGAFFYSGTPGSGNLTASIAPSSGTDSFGNAYLAGITAYSGSDYANLNNGVGTFTAAAALNVAGPVAASGTSTFSGNVDVTGSGALQVSGPLTVSGSVYFNGSGMDLGNGSFASLTLHPKMATPSFTPLGTDPNTGGTWATGERGYYDDAASAINDITSSMQNRGMMN